MKKIILYLQLLLVSIVANAASETTPPVIYTFNNKASTYVLGGRCKASTYVMDNVEGFSVNYTSDDNFYPMEVKLAANPNIFFQYSNNGIKNNVVKTTESYMVCDAKNFVLKIPVVAGDKVYLLYSAKGASPANIQLYDINPGAATPDAVTQCESRDVPVTFIAEAEHNGTFQIKEVSGGMRVYAISINIDPDDSFVDIKDVYMNLKMGESKKLQYSSHSKSDNTIVWNSSNPSVATVDENGNVTALYPGSATITATLADGSETSDECEVNVYIPAESIALDKETLNLTTGNTSFLSPTISESATYKTVTWMSSMPSVASVDSEGTVTALKNGVTTITATTTDGTNLSASCVVTVTTLATSLALNVHELSMYVGNTKTISPTVLPTETSNKNLVWESSDESVATVDGNGNVKAIDNGTATITATTSDGSNLTELCTVTVTTLASSIALDKTNVNITVGNGDNIKASISPSTASSKAVSWTSNNPSVATVDVNGYVVGVANGTATITAQTTDGSNLTASCVVKVTTPVENLSFSQSEVALNTGKTALLTANIEPSTASTKTLVWSSSDTSVATVSTSGVVTAKGNGDAIITAKTTDGTELTATCTVRVTTLVTSVSMNRSSVTMHPDDVQTLTATVYPTTASNKELTWTSSNPAVAAVDAVGQVIALANGTTTIKATANNGVYTSCTVTVTTLMTGISLDYSTIAMNAGDVKTVTATVSPESTSNKSISWTSSNTSVASVNSYGQVTAVGNGVATITARANDGSGVSASCTVTVTTKSTGISLSAYSTSMTVGDNKKLIASVYPSTSSVKDVVWSSSDETVATVTDNGLVTALKKGAAVITVTTTDGTKLSAECKITVSNIADTDVSKLSNTMYIENTKVLTDDTAVLSIKMKNNTPISAFQAQLYLPEEVTITKVSRGARLKDKNSDDEYNFTFENSTLADGSRMLLAYTPSNNVFSGNDGEMINITISVPADMEPDEYPVMLKEIELSKDGSSLRTPLVKSTLFVTDYMDGDANGDRNISVADLTAIAGHLLGRGVSNFNEKAADISGDGHISVADITAVARLVLTGSANQNSLRNIAIENVNE